MRRVLALFTCQSKREEYNREKAQPVTGFEQEIFLKANKSIETYFDSYPLRQIHIRRKCNLVDEIKSFHI